MTEKNDSDSRDLNARIEHTTIRLRKDQLLARRHLRKARKSARDALATPGALLGAAGLGFLLERSGLLRSKRVPKGLDDRHGSDRRRTKSGGSLLTFKNIMTVATTSLALLQKLDKKKVEAQKEKAEAEKEQAEARQVKTEARLQPQAQGAVQVKSNGRAVH